MSRSPSPVSCSAAQVPALPDSEGLAPKQYRLLGPDGPYVSAMPGLVGGYRPKKIYGRLDCASANRAIAKGGYVKHRVFFQDEQAAWACGYRPCAKCLPGAYLTWKSAQPAPAPAPDSPIPVIRHRGPR